MKESAPQDGVRAMVPRERMPEHVRKYRDAYAIVPDAPLVQRPFYFPDYEQFYQQGLDPNADVNEMFGLIRRATMRSTTLVGAKPSFIRCSRKRFSRTAAATK